MTDQERIKKIEEIYQIFLTELRELKDKAGANTQAKIKSIEKKEIDKILNKIHNQL
ncbi:hypothetical protein HOD19_02180 [bacterium]|jgi:hypothetical protein|nr:hypothetical protein [bacterium]MBT4648731.1 hypothetical protein [bacterium]